MELSAYSRLLNIDFEINHAHITSGRYRSKHDIRNMKEIRDKISRIENKLKKIKCESRFDISELQSLKGRVSELRDTYGYTSIGDRVSIFFNALCCGALFSEYTGPSYGNTPITRFDVQTQSFVPNFR